MKRQQSISKENLIKINKLTKIHINRFKGEFKDSSVFIKEIFPIIDVRGKKDILYEVSFRTSKNEDNGSAIISLSTEYHPFIRFSFDGKALIELLMEKVGNWNFVAVFYTSLYIIAESQDGKYLNEIGIKPDLISRKKRTIKKPEKPDYKNFKKSFANFFNENLESKQEDYKKAWSNILKSGFVSSPRSSDYIDLVDMPDHNYQTKTAKYSWALPRYSQIPPNTGVNENDFKSGCAACAWMCLIGYYDNTYTADILRGNHTDNGSEISYQNKVMMTISRYLGTYQLEDDGGYLDLTDVKKGYDYIENFLGFKVKNKKHTVESSMDSFQIVYDKLLTKGVPSVICIPGHALIAYEIKANMDDLSEDHYLRVYQGHGSNPSYDSYLPFEELIGAWSLDWIEPNLKSKFNAKSKCPPSTADLGDELLLVYRKENGNIGLLFTEDGLTIKSKKEIQATGHSSPSVTSNGKYFYIAWADQETSTDGPLRLYKGDIGNSNIEKMPAPITPDEDKNCTPAIIAFNGGIYFVWKSKKHEFESYIAFCPFDDLEKSGHPWPNEIGTLNTAFRKCLPVDIDNRPTLATDGNFLIMGYSDPNLTSDTKSYATILNKQGEGVPYYAVGYDPYRHDTGCNLCYFNNTLYSCTNGIINQVDIVEEYWSFGVIKYKLLSNEVLWPKTLPFLPDPDAFPGYPDITGTKINQNILGKFENMENGPFLFSCWIDSEGFINIQYHSIDRPGERLDYSVWPHPDYF